MVREMTVQRRRALALAAFLPAVACAGIGSTPRGPWPGRRSRFPGGRRLDFLHAGRPAILVVPREPAAGRPWLWRGEFFGAAANVDEALVARGWHLAYLDCKNTFGSPETLRRWDDFYRWLTTMFQLARRPVLLGISRGGLFVYRWAARHPDRVGLIYADAPVCDVKSWPGGKGQGRGSARDWRLFLEVFAMTDAQAVRWRGNPIDLLAPIARAKVPLVHVVGDHDDIVPLDENTAVLAERYRRLGGRIDVWVKKGIGHHPHGYDDPRPLVDFILRHRLPG
jgi:pimeloyl-ACP methyl ester carboxylesterase